MTVSAGPTLPQAAQLYRELAMSLRETPADLQVCLVDPSTTLGIYLDWASCQVFREEALIYGGSAWRKVWRSHRCLFA